MNILDLTFNSTFWHMMGLIWIPGLIVIGILVLGIRKLNTEIDKYV